MPIPDYGVWKAKAVRFTYETKEQDSDSPHLSLYFADSAPGEGRAAINIKSTNKAESRLVFWRSKDFRHPLTAKLGPLGFAFHPLENTADQGPNGRALDYIRFNLFQRDTGALLEHDIDGQDNDIIDALVPMVEDSLESKAIYIWGARFDNGKGIHDVHMNQGNTGRFLKDNGVWQDGGIIIEYGDHWEAVFIAFATQAVHTTEKERDSPGGNPIDGALTWKTLLEPGEGPDRPDITETPVVISAAMVNPIGPDNQPGTPLETVTLTNRSDRDISLSGWTIRNKTNQFQPLPANTILHPGESKTFEVPKSPLSNQGGTITLLNQDGLKVHGVSYTRAEARQENRVIVFG